MSVVCVFVLLLGPPVELKIPSVKNLVIIFQTAVIHSLFHSLSLTLFMRLHTHCHYDSEQTSELRGWHQQKTLWAIFYGCHHYNKSFTSIFTTESILHFTFFTTQTTKFWIILFAIFSRCDERTMNVTGWRRKWKWNDAMSQILCCRGEKFLIYIILEKFSLFFLSNFP